MHLSGHLIGLLSFDVGHAIDLTRARPLAPQPATGTIERRRAAPLHLRYPVAPLRLLLGPHPVVIDGCPMTADATAMVHDVGAITIILQTPLTSDVDALPRLTATLTSAGSLEDAARAILGPLCRRLEPAIIRPLLRDICEDYYILLIEGVDPPQSITDILANAREPLAAALRCEPEMLSPAETDDVFRTGLSYYRDDLVITEWNVALVVDSDATDTVSILEYLNVQLLELRVYDAVLDQQLAADAEHIASPVWYPLRYRRYRRLIEELAAIRVDVATIVERLHNALKLSGDIYLAKVYTRTAERLALQAWEDSVAEKLDVLQQRYDVLVQRLAAARAEGLELAIIVLILVELLLGFWGRR